MHTVSEGWIQTMREHPDGNITTFDKSGKWCDGIDCMAIAPHDIHDTLKESCPVLVIPINPAAEEITGVSTVLIWELNKMDCSKRFSCGLWDYDPVALFIDNRDIRRNHVNFSVLVRYEEDWFSVTGRHVAYLPSVGKDAVVMVWALRAKKWATSWLRLFG